MNEQFIDTNFSNESCAIIMIIIVAVLLYRNLLKKD